ncbi:MAG: hypothetical protein JXN59_17905 [Anaerolineae bacterium]|nr:hypothetical protein [Anaerolineae bacterium]
MSRRRRRSAPMGNKAGRALLGFLLIMIGLSAFNDFPFGLLMFVGGLTLLVAMMSRAQTTQGEAAPIGAFARAIRDEISEAFASENFALEESSDPPQRRGGSTRPSAGAKARAARKPGRMHRVAAKAVRQAGQDPASLVVAPVDVGVLAYENRSATPTLYRETHLPDEAEFIRPFTLLRSPRHARGTIRFELIDGDGNRRFVDESDWELKAGETFVYPPTWLPMRTVDDLGGEWTMRVYAANTLLAAHEFMWRDLGGGEFRQYLTGDGEISENLAEEITSTRLGRLSLDDLLDDQEGGVIELDPEAEAAARRHDEINRQYTNRR